MTRALRMVGLAAALAAPAVLSAQSADKPVSFGVSGGLSMPMGDLGDVADAGFNVNGHAYFKPAALRSVGLRVDLGYDRWGVKDADGYNLRSISGVLNATYDIPSSSGIKPYILGGVGAFNAKLTGDGLTDEETDSETDLGIQVGGGLRFQLSGFSTFVEAKYVNVFGDGDSANWIPITFGIRF